VNQNITPIPADFNLQPSLRPQLHEVLNNVDYRSERELLERIDAILVQSGLESDYIHRCEAQIEAEVLEAASAKWLQRHRRHSMQALRSCLLKELTGLSYRALSVRMADSELFRWFLHLADEGVVRVPSKSTLQDYATRLPHEQMRAIIDRLLAQVMTPGEEGEAPFELEHLLEMETVWMDSTCLEANIHFPVDWVLLRDAARTLLKAIMLIRRYGLKHRMPDPSKLLRAMNRLCIQMTQSRRKKNGKKARKAVLRDMEKLAKTIGAHAERYHAMLEERWEQTDWSRKQAGEVLARMEGIIGQLPEAIAQAHQRIISEQKMENEKKKLSLYEPEAEVIVRGKAGVEVEFGNMLFVAEQEQGLVVDWELCAKGAPSDSALFERSLERLMEQGGVSAICADRGFDSKANRKLCEEKGINNGLCPRNVQQLRERMTEPEFAFNQRRRAQTEARIGILKNNFLGEAVKAKGFAHRQVMVDWAVLAHNLWVLARLPRRERSQAAPLAQAA